MMVRVQGPGRGGTCGLLIVPGFTHPVQEFFLEDVLEATKYSIGRTSKYAKPPPPDCCSLLWIPPEICRRAVAGSGCH